MTLQNFTLGTFAQGAAGGGGSFESIASNTLSSSTATVTFSSIPSTYQHLQIRYLARTTRTGNNADVLYLTVNSSSTGYSIHILEGDGATASAQGYANQPYFQGNYLSTNNLASGIFGVGIIDIHDYKSTTKNKTIRGFLGYDGNGNGTVSLDSSVWQSTNAITSVTLDAAVGDFVSGSTFALYGIKGA